MATRATYSIEKGMNEKVYSFYIHWDGYPEGAATYFEAMLKHSKGLISPESFLRANEGASFTVPSQHGDTEYHYDLDRDHHLIVKSRKYGGRWTIAEATSLASFLTEKLKETNDTWIKFEDRTVSFSMLKEEHQQKVEAYLNYKTKFPTMTGNISSLKSEADKWGMVVARLTGKEAPVINLKEYRK